MRKTAFIIAILLVATAVNPVSAKTLSDEQKGLISSNCSSIIFQLKKVQKEDSKNRVHLGAQYESISTNLMMNLNLRLVKNNMASAAIAEQQTTFMSERDRFKNDFIGYAQSLDELISIDCKNDPQKFYDKLKNVRNKRAEISYSMGRLQDIINEHQEAIHEMIEGLKNE